MTEASHTADAASSLERRAAATISDMRGRRGLGQAELAALLGVPAERIARLESGEAGQAASLATLAEIAHRLDFHVTIGLHDRQPPAIGGGTNAAPIEDALAPGETLAALSLDDGVELGSAPDIVLADDVAITIPDEPDHSFLLDDSAPGMTVQKQKDDTFSPGGGGDGFSDGMSS